jgi:branched-chain amino acid transport system permease protein
MPWAVAGVLLVVGIVLYRWIQPTYYAVWGEVNAEIAAKQRGSMA